MQTVVNTAVRQRVEGEKLYHIVPRDMEGDIIYPLNRMKETHPEVFEREVGKYRGRESVCEHPIPPLGCLWNDVVFLSPVHPEKLAEIARALGKSWFSADYFEIDPDIAGMSSENTAVSFQLATPELEPKRLIIEPYDQDILPHVSEVSEAQKEYMKKCADSGEPCFRFLFVPHVLFRGEIDTRQAKKITVL